MSNSTSLNSISLILQSQVQRIFPLQELKTSTKFPLLDVSMIYFGLLWHGDMNEQINWNLFALNGTSLSIYLFLFFCAKKYTMHFCLNKRKEKEGQTVDFIIIYIAILHALLN